MTAGEWIALGGLVLAAVAAIAGPLVWYMNQQFAGLRKAAESCVDGDELRRVEGRVETAWGEIGRVREDLRAHELKVAEHYVRHEHLDGLEKRIIARFDKLEAAFDRAMNRAKSSSQQ